MWRDARGYAALTWRSLRRSHDPLRRRVDRVEGTLAVAVAVLLVALLPLAVWLGALVGDQQTAIAHQQARDFRQVTATTAADSAADSVSPDPTPVATVESAPAHWEWAGVTHRADVAVDPGTRAGTEVQIWVDPDGDLASRPISPSDAATSGIFVAVFTWVSGALVAFTGFLAARGVLNRRRDREWSREIREFLGTATSY
ncbi:membrane protein [Rhodococcus olei]|uniref:Membrane protein n=1 Tax=Rhodococcus olei TaxID=2161675 RepID=A0ABP8PDV4_9NOCA